MLVSELARIGAGRQFFPARHKSLRCLAVFLMIKMFKNNWLWQWKPPCFWRSRLVRQQISISQTHRVGTFFPCEAKELKYLGGKPSEPRLPFSSKTPAPHLWSDFRSSYLLIGHKQTLAWKCEKPRGVLRNTQIQSNPASTASLSES